MKPLISIETVPISIEYVKKQPESRSSSNHLEAQQEAQKRAASQSAQLEVSKENDRITIRSNPIHISAKDSFQHNMQSSLAYTATANYSKGVLSMDVNLQNNAAGNQIRFEQAGNNIDRMVDSVQKETQAYEPLPMIGMKVDFDISQLSEKPVADTEANFIPPDIEMEVVEYPKVIIEYIGGPLYFPKSADPDFVPPEDYGSNVASGQTEKPEYEAKA